MLLLLRLVLELLLLFELLLRLRLLLLRLKLLLLLMLLSLELGPLLLIHDPPPRTPSFAPPPRLHVQKTQPQTMPTPVVRGGGASPRRPRPAHGSTPSGGAHCSSRVGSA